MVRVMVFNVTFNNISFILWCQFYWWRKPENPGRITDLPQVTDLKNMEKIFFGIFFVLVICKIWNGYLIGFSCYATNSRVICKVMFGNIKK